MWLLSKGKADEARAALRKLRGGATADKCDEEFQDMVGYAAETGPDDDQKGYDRSENSAHLSIIELHSAVFPHSIRSSRPNITLNQYAVYKINMRRCRFFIFTIASTYEKRDAICQV